MSIIEKNIPIPKYTRKRVVPHRDALLQMEVGDSFLYKHRGSSASAKQYMRMLRSAIAPTIKIKMAAEGEKTIRVWRVA